MALFLVALLLAVAVHFLQSRAQRARILLLAGYLRPYRIEPLMEQVVEGTLRWMGEADAERRAPLRAMLDESERTLAQQLERFAASFSGADAAATRTSSLPIALPLAERWLPARSFDARALFTLHARSVAACVADGQAGQTTERAYRLVAELMLFQHSCHWYCRSRATASARLVARHRTPWQQVLGAIDPRSRRDYAAITGL